MTPALAGAPPPPVTLTRSSIASTTPRWSSSRTSIAADDLLTTPNAAHPIYHPAWRDGERLYGNVVVNNKGMLASWMIAGKAIEQAIGEADAAIPDSSLTRRAREA